MSETSVIETFSDLRHVKNSHFKKQWRSTSTLRPLQLILLLLQTSFLCHCLKLSLQINRLPLETVYFRKGVNSDYIILLAETQRCRPIYQVLYFGLTNYTMYRLLIICWFQVEIPNKLSGHTFDLFIIRCVDAVYLVPNTMFRLKQPSEKT